MFILRMTSLIPIGSNDGLFLIGKRTKEKLEIGDFLQENILRMKRKKEVLKL